MRPALLLVLPAAVLLAQGQPTFYAAYEDGRDFERAGRWKEALAAYLRAIELRPRPAAKVVIYGNNLLLDYYPYAHAARCQLELGQSEPARTLLRRSEETGEPESLRASLRSRLAPTAPGAVAPTPPAPAPPVHAPAEVPSEPAPTRVLESAPVAHEPSPAAASKEPPPAPAPAAPVRTTPVAEQKPPIESAAPPAPPVNRSPPAPASLPATDPAPASPWLKPGLYSLAAAVLAGLLLLARRRPAPEAGYRDPVQVGPFRIDRLLGRGGFASTYLASHQDTGARVALKVLHPFRQEDPEFRQRFQQEAQLGALLDHPNLVRMVGHGAHAGLSWIAMEYVSGERLDQRLRAGRLPLAEAARIGREIAAAMAHAHGHGVVHRDLKPSNVMLADGRAKVMDFGISRRMDAETLTTTYAFLGTPLYAAPEVQLKTQVGPAADRYALGIILFEMLAGRTPFAGETPFEILDQHRSAALPDLAALRPDAPPALVRLVERLCRKSPDERPEDAELLEVLDGAAG